MQNGLLKVNLSNIADAVMMAVVFAILSAAVNLVSTTGFDVFNANWIMIGKNMVNLGVVAGVVSLGQALLTTNSGSVLGVTPSR